MENREIAKAGVSPENLELLKIALKTAELAGVEWKADKTPVTIADKGTEELARKFWAKETPGFGVIGEEFGIESPDAEYQWVIDPIDGTKSFIHGVPLFGTLIGLYHKNVPIASVIRLPAMKSAVWAVNGGGAFLDGREVHASKVSQLSDALVLSGTVNTMEDKGFGEGFTKLRRSARPPQCPLASRLGRLLRLLPRGCRPCRNHGGSGRFAVGHCSVPALDEGSGRQVQYHRWQDGTL